MKQKLRSYEFWMSLASAVALVASLLGADVPYVREVCSAVIGLLVVIGIVKKPPASSETATVDSQNEQSGIAADESDDAAQQIDA